MLVAILVLSAFSALCFFVDMAFGIYSVVRDRKMYRLSLKSFSIMQLKEEILRRENKYKDFDSFKDF